MSVACANTSGPIAPGLSIVERLRGEQEAINSPGLQAGLRKRGDWKFPVRALLSTGRAMEGKNSAPQANA